MSGVTAKLLVTYTIHCKIIRIHCNAIQTLLQLNSNNPKCCRLHEACSPCTIAAGNLRCHPKTHVSSLLRARLVRAFEPLRRVHRNWFTSLVRGSEKTVLAEAPHDRVELSLFPLAECRRARNRSNGSKRVRIQARLRPEGSRLC